MNIKDFILDMIFPIHCIACDKIGAWICDECFRKIILKNEQVCPLCKKSFTANGETCFSCRYESDIDGVLVASFYRKDKAKTILAKLIHYYKYRFISDINLPLGKILEKSILLSSLKLPDIIVPVPLHHRRLRWRGFNQSQLLAHYLGINLTPGLEIPVFKNIILRNRYTLPQMQVKNRLDRKNNVKGAFIFNKKEFHSKQIKDKNILLVDDIITTGSTLFECAKVLKKNGAKKAYAIVLARQ